MHHTMKDELTKKIKKRYDRVSGIYDMMDNMIKEDWRREALKGLKGNLLEVGIGTGANLPYYSDDVFLTGIDFSTGMLEKARKKADTLNLPFQLDLLEMDAQDMQFENDSFDYIVATCVFCSVPDPVKGLKEIRRVCKPSGKIVLLEHMRSENEVIGTVMDIMNPLTVKVWGANINRKTLDNIRSAGLQIEENESLFSTIVRKLVLNPNK